MKKIKSGRKLFVSQLYKNNKGSFAGTLIILVFNAVLIVGIAYLLQIVMDAAASGTVEQLVKILVFALLYIGCLTVGWLVERSVRNRFVEKAIRQYKSYVFDRITKKSIGSFAEESTGKYISALTNDVTSVETNYLSGTISLVLNVLYLVLAIALMLWYDWRLTLIAAGLGSLSLLIALAVGGRLEKAEKQVSERNEGFVGMVKDLLTGFTVIKSFKAELEAAKLFESSNGALERTKCRRRRTEALINLIAESLGIVTQSALMIVGAFFAIKGYITVGVLVAYVQLMNYLIGPMQLIPTQLANRKAALALIDKIATAVEDHTGRSGSVELSDIGEGIAFENVTFGYDADEPVLWDISIRFETGKSCAIVGASGSGKSTLLNLLLGSWDGYKGRITIGGAELREISPDSLYDTLSIIQQNVFIFDSTIENNITMFKQFEKDRIDSAVRRAGLEKLIAERGAEYSCGENGSGLSGGEKQRISIARCLMRETPVLLMDEATAALDSATAHAVEESILSIEGLTRIIVTHKLEESILRRYDSIVVISGGRAAETGTFDELMSRGGYFKSLYTVSHSE